jgi:hypothetical protein
VDVVIKKLKPRTRPNALSSVVIDAADLGGKGDVVGILIIIVGYPCAAINIGIKLHNIRVSRGNDQPEECPKNG